MVTIFFSTYVTFYSYNYHSHICAIYSHRGWLYLFFIFLLVILLFYVLINSRYVCGVVCIADEIIQFVSVSRQFAISQIRMKQPINASVNTVMRMCNVHMDIHRINCSKMNFPQHKTQINLFCFTNIEHVSRCDRYRDKCRIEELITNETLFFALYARQMLERQC